MTIPPEESISAFQRMVVEGLLAAVVAPGATLLLLRWGGCNNVLVLVVLFAAYWRLPLPEPVTDVRPLELLTFSLPLVLFFALALLRSWTLVRLQPQLSRLVKVTAALATSALCTALLVVTLNVLLFHVGPYPWVPDAPR